MTIFRLQAEQDQDRRDRARHATNAARHAEAFFTLETTGSGSIIPDDPISFDTVFIQPPAIVSGAVLVELPDSAYHELPVCSVGVMRWVTNERGHYTGAYVYAAVHVPAKVDANGDPVAGWADNPPQPVIHHHVVASGVAYKKLPDSMLADLTAEM